MGTWESFRGVACHVAFQVGTVAKPNHGNRCNWIKAAEGISPLTTLITDKLGLCTVLPLLVLLQQLPGSEGDSTDVARHFLTVLLMHMQLVKPQARLVGIALATSVTEVVEPQLCLFFRESLLSEVHLPRKQKHYYIYFTTS